MSDRHPIRVGISACLLGQEVRYDGGHKRDRFLTDTFGQFVEWVPGQSIKLERNKDYWNKDLPLLDGLEIYHALPFSPEMASYLLSGRVDYVRVTDPATLRRAKTTQGMAGTD